MNAKKILTSFSKVFFRPSIFSGITRKILMVPIELFCRSFSCKRRKNFRNAVAYVDFEKTPTFKVAGGSKLFKIK